METNKINMQNEKMRFFVHAFEQQLEVVQDMTEEKRQKVNEQLTKMRKDLLTNEERYNKLIVQIDNKEKALNTEIENSDFERNIKEREQWLT